MTDSFLAALARPQPIPPGGAAMAHAVLVALALTEKVVRLEARRKNVSETEAGFWAHLLSQVRAISQESQALQEEDGLAYQGFLEAGATGKDSKEWRTALARTVEVPLQIMSKAQEALVCAARAGERCKVHLRPDCHAACELLKGACGGARAIARANLAMLGTVPHNPHDSSCPLPTSLLRRVFSFVRAAFFTRGTRRIHSH